MDLTPDWPSQSEERLAETLREESKVTRRGLGMSDRLIHLGY